MNNDLNNEYKGRVFLIYPPSPVMNREDRCQQPTDDLIVIPPLPPSDLMYLASIARQEGYEPRIKDYSLMKHLTMLLKILKSLSPSTCF